MATILVIEDDPDMRELERTVLACGGHQVIVAENGREGLRALEGRRPCVILLDLMMPVMDGFEFLAELRQEEAWRQIPVIVVTAKNLSPEEHERLNGSVARILQKGAYDRQALLAEVRALVAASVRQSLD